MTRPGAAACRLLAAAGLTLGPVALMGGRAFADPGGTGPNLGGWNASADANAIDVVFDNQTGLAGIHPVDEADFPEAQSVFETGPFGSGLASVFWPGAAAGNLGSLSSELGIPAQLQPVVSQLNDPARAAAQYPAGPASSSFPPGAPNGTFDMQSQSGATGTTATSDIASQTASRVLGFSAARSTSSATAVNTANASAATNLSGMSLLGGIVGIASIQSAASASSDGTHSTGSATIHIAGVTVMGQPASIGSDGLVLPNPPNLPGSPLGPVLGGVTGSVGTQGVVHKLMSQTINALGLTITELPSTQTQNGPSDSVTSGGLAITINPPPAAAAQLEQVAALIAPYFPAQAAAIPTLPGLLQGATLTITIGRATASAAASPPFNNTFNPLAFVPGTPGGPASAGTPGVPASGGGSPAAPSPAGGAAAPAGLSSVTAAPSSTASRAQPSSNGSLPADLVSLSTPLAAGVVAAALAAAAGLGYGLWRLAGLLRVEDAGPVCPLGEGE